MISDSGGLSPTHEADVVIVGGGGAGMSAALSATEHSDDRDILLLQKIGELGGSTTMAAGSFTASDSYLQAENDIPDSSEAHYMDIDKFINEASQIERYAKLGRSSSLRDRDNTDLRKILVQNSADTLQWLHEYGCEYAGPYLEPPHRVPRMHQIKQDTTAYRDVLGPELEERGVNVFLDTEVYELIETDGIIRGVLAKQVGKRNPMIITASEGVVLATGDYVNGMDYREKYTDDAESKPINDHNTGDGHEMAENAGAELVNMDMQYPIFRFGDPLYTGPEILSLLNNGAILVSDKGTRFVNEDAEYDQIYDSVLRQEIDKIYVVFDAETAKLFTEWPNFVSTLGRDGQAFGFIDYYLETSYLTTCSTLTDLESSLVLNGSNLRETVLDYNSGRYDEEHDMFFDRFGRTESYEPLTEFPLYVLGPIRPYVVITLGGVAINEEMQVLDSDGEPIEQLYAAGSIAGSFLMFGHGHHHSWIFTTGRLAGKAVLKN